MPKGSEAEAMYCSHMGGNGPRVTDIEGCPRSGHKFVSCGTGIGNCAYTLEPQLFSLLDEVGNEEGRFPGARRTMYI